MDEKVKEKKKGGKWKYAIIIFLAVVVLGTILAPEEDTKPTTANKPKETTEKAEEEPKTKTTEVSKEEPKEEPEEELTLGQKNALGSAEDYLNYASFSHKGLIEQLEYDEYTKEDATFAADNCGADWNEQAERKAQEYLDYSSFSKGDLISQLEYDGFTKEQAEHGVKAVGY